MTVPATNGVFSYGLQTAKGTLASTFYRHRATDIDFGPVEQQQTMPPEVGGILTPTGAFKSGAFVAGGATVHPRMEGDLGWVMKALLGEVSSVDAVVDDDAVLASRQIDGSTVTTGITDPPSPGKKVVLTVTLAADQGSVADIVVNGPAATPTESFALNGLKAGTHVLRGSTTFTDVNNIVLPTVTGGYVKVGYLDTVAKDHIFKMATDQSSLPWVSVRKYVPGATALGEQGLDCRAAGAAFTFPNGGLIQSRLDFYGREPSWDDNPSWTYADAFESFESIPLTCNVDGAIYLPMFSTAKQTITALQLQWANQLTQADQEKIIGSPYPDDVAVLGRSMSIRATLKWNDPNLYLKILTGSVSGTTWSDSVFTTDFDALVKAPALVAGGSLAKYALRIMAAKVGWAVDGPVRLAGGGMLTVNLQGNVLDPGSSLDYAKFILTNGQANYS